MQPHLEECRFTRAAEAGPSGDWQADLFGPPKRQSKGQVWGLSADCSGLMQIVVRVSAQEKINLIGAPPPEDLTHAQ